MQDLAPWYLPAFSVSSSLTSAIKSLINENNILIISLIKNLINGGGESEHLFLEFSLWNLNSESRLKAFEAHWFGTSKNAVGGK